jgi:adenylate kinase family enzyme
VQRVAIIGTGGAGKSTLARQMGERLGVEVIHLDQLYWNPGWEPTPGDRWRALQTRLVQGESWIMDGNYGDSLPIRVAAADTVVFVDLPRRITIPRAVGRWWRSRGREVQAFGCPERISWEFLVWMWRFPRVSRPRLLAALPPRRDGPTVVILRSGPDVARFLARLDAQT